MISFFLVFAGTFDIILAISARREMEAWWLQLVGGIIELALGFWAAGYYGRSAILLVAWVGAFAVIRGVMDTVLAFRMPRDAVAHFPRQVQALAVVFEQINDAEALLVVLEPSGHERLEHTFAGVAERRVPEVVAERDRLGELLVEPEHLRNAARDLRHFERVR